MGSPSEVQFEAYCTAAKALDAQLAEELCAALDKTDGQWTPKMLRDKPGDGYVLVPSYADVGGKWQVSAWRRLSADGSIEVLAGTEYQGEDSVDAMFATYFIAGAFGVSEVPGHPVDTALVADLQKLYKECVRDKGVCLSSATAQSVLARWAGVKELDSLRDKAEELKGQLETKIARAAKKDELMAKLATYRADLPQHPTSAADYKKAIDIYNQMIGVVDRHVAGVAQTGKEQDMATQISFYISESDRLMAQIKKEEPFGYSRFTNAMEAGLACMSVGGATILERYCAAKRKYEMLGWVLGKVHEFNGYPRCVRTGKVREYEEKCGLNGCSTDSSHFREVEKCVEYVHPDFSFDEDRLISAAKAYCSSTCN
jgi:hypothetical protein